MKKNQIFSHWRKGLTPWGKILKTMKVFTFLMLVAIVHVSASSYSQNSRLSLNMKNATIKDVLMRIEEQSEYRFLYSDSKIDVEKKVNIDLTDMKIEDILNTVFDGTDIGYRIVSRQILLSSKSESSQVGQQARSVTGKVTDSSGAPLPGVSVVIKGTTNGIITDADGNYSLANVSTDATLVFSFVGMKAQEVSVAGKTSINVKMEEETVGIEEVVAIGYGTMKKSDLTGSVSNIKAEKFFIQAPRNVQDLLRANAAGLNISIATDAKAEASLSIRGKGTLAANGDPLIVIDGVIYEGVLADINPQDISNIDILKDASSSAVYGAKSANGVIVITTKKGKIGKPIININSNISIAHSASQPEILDAEGFLKFRQDYNEGRNSETYLTKYPQIFTNPEKLNGVSELDWYNYDQTVPATSLTDSQLTTKWLSRLNLTSPEIDNYFKGNITKWNDLVFQNAIQQDYTVSVSNATDYTTQYWSLGWTDREGIIVGDRYKNFRARVNIESKIVSFLTVGLNAQFASRNEGFLKCNWSQMTMISPYGSNNINDLQSVYRRRPTGLDPVNPFYDNLYTDRKNVSHTLNTSLYAKVFLPLGIEYQLNYTPHYNWYEYYNHYSSDGELWKSTGGQSTRTTSKSFNWQIDNILRWKKEFASIHKIEITLLANAEKAQYWSTTANATKYSPNDILGYHRLQAGEVQTVSSNDTYQTGDALMGRIFYSLKNKYMATASVRRDGYSAFGKKNPHAVFPAIALGWAFTQEKFLTNIKWLNYGKLRFSWGENGNRSIGKWGQAYFHISINPEVFILLRKFM